MARRTRRAEGTGVCVAAPEPAPELAPEGQPALSLLAGRLARRRREAQWRSVVEAEAEGEAEVEAVWVAAEPVGGRAAATGEQRASAADSVGAQRRWVARTPAVSFGQGWVVLEAERAAASLAR